MTRDGERNRNEPRSVGGRVHAFGEMARARVRRRALRPGDLIGAARSGPAVSWRSGTQTLGRYLDAGRRGRALASIGSDRFGHRSSSDLPDRPRGRARRPSSRASHRADGAADWPAVKRIYAEGIATGDATLEREAPDFGHFDRSHRQDCRLVARLKSEGRSWAGSPSPPTRLVASTAVSPGRASTSPRKRVGRASAGHC